MSSARREQGFIILLSFLASFLTTENAKARLLLRSGLFVIRVYRSQFD
jgi:hypothetical protein